jgi:hypothetical protein
MRTVGREKLCHADVHDSTGRYEDPETHPAPAAVICLDCAYKSEKWAEYTVTGERALVFDYIVVFSGAGMVANRSASSPNNR